MFGSRFKPDVKNVTEFEDWFPTKTTYSGSNVTQTSASTLLAVFGAQQFIADTIATLPVGTFRKDGDTPVEVASPSWIERPNPETDRVTFIGQCVSSWLTDGNLFVAPFRNNRYEVIEAWVLDPTKVELRRDNPGAPLVPYVNGMPYRGELVHVPAYMPAGAVRGLSPIECARQSIGLGMAAVEHGARFFGQGATMSGVINTPGELTPEQAKQLKDGWGRAHSGVANSHLPAVLSGGATWTQTQITNEQAQFLETRKFTAAEIVGQVYLLDPSLLGIAVDGTSLTYANLEQRGIHLVTFSLLRWLIRLERLYTGLLPQPVYSKLNVAGLMRGDLSARYTAYRQGLDPAAPFLTVDEVRKLEDRPPMPAPAPPVTDGGFPDGSA